LSATLELYTADIAQRSESRTQLNAKYFWQRELQNEPSKGTKGVKKTEQNKVDFLRYPTVRKLNGKVPCFKFVLGDFAYNNELEVHLLQIQA